MEYKTIIGFTVGAIIGAGVGVLATKNIYKKKADDEINEVRAIYAEKMGRIKPVYTGPSEPETKKTITTDTSKIFGEKPPLKEVVNSFMEEKRKYNEIADAYRSDDKEPTAKRADAYVISPDEFGEMESYDTKLLTYYADDILVEDETEEIIENIEGTISVASLDHIGDYEDGIVHVRNDTLACDYEISRDNRNWRDLAEDPITTIDEE